MEIIRDWKDLKFVDNNYTYACIGFTRGNHLFNPTHDNVYSYTINKAQKLFATVWDNYYDLEVFSGRPGTPAAYNEHKVIEWFQDRGFDYLFLPATSFIHELVEEPLFKEMRSLVDKIWEDEGYYDFLCNWYSINNSSWVKLVLSRTYRLFSNQYEYRLVNRVFQATGPDGTWGFLYRHFWEKYCGGNYVIVPLIRDHNNVAVDLLMQKYPKEVMDIFYGTREIFENFRTVLAVDLLEDDLTLYMDKLNNNFKFNSLIAIRNEITLNEYVVLFSIKNTENNAEYRMWEYSKNI